MVQNYLKTLFLSIKRQKGFAALNLFVLAASMIVIMVLISILNILWNQDLQNLKEGNIFSLKIKDQSYFNPNMDEKKVAKIVQCFPPEELCLISLTHSGSIILKHKNKELNYRYINKNFSEILELEFVEGGNFLPKHFDSKQKVIVLSENLAITNFGSTDVVGKDFILSQDRYKIVGIYKNLIRESTFSADLYVPWNIHEYPEHLMPSVFVKGTEGTTKSVIHNQLQKHATDSKIVVLTMAELRQKAQGKTLTSALFLIGLAFLLPALLLTNLTEHRMEISLQELGLRKAFGAPRKVIYHHLLIENIVFTLIAGCFAFLIGQYLVSSLYYGFTNSFWRFEVPMNVFWAVFIFFIFFGIVTGIIPARRVARQTIVQSLNAK